MHRLIAILLYTLAALLILLAVATLVSMVYIATRPETISVVHYLVGQAILIICLLTLSHHLLHRAQTKWRGDSHSKGEHL